MVSPSSRKGTDLIHSQPDIMTVPGICATSIQNKERSAERELIDYLERVRPQELLFNAITADWGYV